MEPYALYNWFLKNFGVACTEFTLKANLKTWVIISILYIWYWANYTSFQTHIWTMWEYEQIFSILTLKNPCIGNFMLFVAMVTCWIHQLFSEVSKAPDKTRPKHLSGIEIIFVCAANSCHNCKRNLTSFHCGRIVPNWLPRSEKWLHSKFHFNNNNTIISVLSHLNGIIAVRHHLETPW